MMEETRAGWAFGHACNALCDGEVHALTVTGRAGLSWETLQRCAGACGWTLHAARRVQECDLRAEQARRTHNWNAATGEFSVYTFAADAQPTDEVWLVHVSMAVALTPSRRGPWWRVLQRFGL
jgi:hypothetical protein